jgi:hypothetical protein
MTEWISHVVKPDSVPAEQHHWGGCPTRATTRTFCRTVFYKLEEANRPAWPAVPAPRVLYPV